MPIRSKSIVLDSWSIIAYLEDEPSGTKVEEIIVEAQVENDVKIHWV